MIKLLWKLVNFQTCKVKGILTRLSFAVISQMAFTVRNCIPTKRITKASTLNELFPPRSIFWFYGFGFICFSKEVYNASWCFAFSGISCSLWNGSWWVKLHKYWFKNKRLRAETQQLIRYDSLFCSPACGKFRFEIGVSNKVTSHCVIVFSWFLHIFFCNLSPTCFC